MQHDDLGRSLSVHPGTFSSGGWLWYVGGILLLAGIFALAKWQLLTAAACFAIAPLVLALPILRWRQRVEVFEHGFVWTRLIGTVRVRRGEVRDTELVQHYSKMGSVLELIVKLADGRELSIQGIDNGEQARAFIAQLAGPQAASGAPITGWQPPGRAA